MLCSNCAERDASRVGAVQPSGQCHWNEDPAHEKAESAQREAEENSGQACTGGGHFGGPGGPGGAFHPNEDPAHEKAESAQREAQENSGQFSPAG